MRKIKYAKLMEKIEDGDAEVDSWACSQHEGEVANVRFYTKSGQSKREMVLVTNLPEDWES